MAGMTSREMSLFQLLFLYWTGIYFGVICRYFSDNMLTHFTASFIAVGIIPYLSTHMYFPLCMSLNQSEVRIVERLVDFLCLWTELQVLKSCFDR